MNIILLGPQGSGKGTQAELLVDKYGYNYFEIGKILRSVAESNNPNAQMVKDFIDKGQLVPDEYVRLIAWDFISKHDKSKGFVFDGYPRSVLQYDHLKDMLAKLGQKIDWVISLEISEAETVRRLSSRRTCSKCGRVYNLITNPPPKAGCECGGELVQRKDDYPEAIKERLKIYQAQTQPVFEKASTEGIGLQIDGERPIDTIHQEIIAKLHLN